MDYQDFNMRKNLSSFVAPGVPRSIEWVWEGSETFGSQYQTFTGELYGGGGGGYGAPNGLDFEDSGNQVKAMSATRLSLPRYKTILAFMITMLISSSTSSFVMP